jgi:hypothetical protein
MKQDSDLDWLRGPADYKTFVAELEADKPKDGK